MVITVLPDGTASGPTIGNVVVDLTKGYMSSNVQDPDGVSGRLAHRDSVNVPQVEQLIRLRPGVNTASITNYSVEPTPM